MQEKKSLARLSPYIPGKPLREVQQEFGLEKVIKLASNENPFGHSKKVQEVLAQAVTNLEYYPDGGARALKETIAAFHQVPDSQLLIGSGLDDVIQIISRALLNHGDEIIVAEPTFSQYELHGVIEGATVIKVPVDETDGQMDLVGMLAAITSQTKIIWLCNPNNPTGTYVPQRQIKDFLKQVPKGVLVISDEAYQEYVTAEDVSTSLPLLANFDNLIVMRTFSKAYGLAGLRIGYAVVPARLSRSFEIVRLPFNTSSIAQVAGVAALEDQAFIQETAKVNEVELAKWEEFLRAQNLEFYHSQANFIFFKVEQDGQQLAQELLKCGFILRSGLRANWLRVTLGYPEDNQALRNQLVQLLHL